MRDPPSASRLDQASLPPQRFSAQELSERVNTLPNGKARKPPIKLEECELVQLVQYKCDVMGGDGTPQTKVIGCKPLLRLFRRCQGGLMVETTQWEWIRPE